ncbi:MAG: hydrogenase maturation nickel metallochaperone HypA [Candidatus Bathyarchaeia archaeon]|nr:hydrogenase maturation nickel metallochaperone HypA [Candidatus Bathyarchaeota archaeon]
MHEFSTAQTIIESILKVAEKHNAKRVTEVNLEIGALTMLNSEQLIFSLTILSEKTIVEGAKFNINYTPVKLKCLNCGYESIIDSESLVNFEWTEFIFQLKCLKCQSREVEVIEGKSCIIKDIKVKV